MKRGTRGVLATLVPALLAIAALPACAQPKVFNVLRLSTASFKSEGLLETVMGTTAGPGITGSLTVDLARPAGATGTISVDLTMIRTGIERRDEAMRSEQFLNTERAVNRLAVFDIKGIEIAGPLEPGREAPAKVRGTLTVKGRPVELVADARVTYLRLAPAEVEARRQSGYTSEILRVKAKFQTSFTNHGMAIPQFYFLRLADEIQLEADLILVHG